ncbi:MAG: hypothetical protein ABSE64_08090 [Vulcanimicrobiaceae bacterium]
MKVAEKKVNIVYHAIANIIEDNKSLRALIADAAAFTRGSYRMTKRPTCL